MSSSKAKQLKHVFADRWRYGVKRELLVWNILNLFLPDDYIVLFTGVGSGASDYVDESYSNPLNAFDSTIFDKEYRPVAFIEITGVNSVRDYDKGKGLCIGAWKVWKAEKYGVQDKVWYIHVITTKQSIRVINYARLKKHAKFQRLNEGYGWHGTFYCLDSKYWGSLEVLIRWLRARSKG